jgi:hypothetical protein
MDSPADYERASATVREVIHTWDPYGLLSGGAPADEWDGEIALLVARIPQIKSDEDAAMAVSTVFSEAFQPKGFTPTDCADVGRRMFSAIKQLD